MLAHKHCLRWCTQMPWHMCGCCNLLTQPCLIPPNIPADTIFSQHILLVGFAMNWRWCLWQNILFLFKLMYRGKIIVLHSGGWTNNVDQSWTWWAGHDHHESQVGRYGELHVQVPKRGRISRKERDCHCLL